MMTGTDTQSIRKEKLTIRHYHCTHRVPLLGELLPFSGLPIIPLGPSRMRRALQEASIHQMVHCSPPSRFLKNHSPAFLRAAPAAAAPPAAWTAPLTTAAPYPPMPALVSVANRLPATTFPTAACAPAAAEPRSKGAVALARIARSCVRGAGILGKKGHQISRGRYCEACEGKRGDGEALGLHSPATIPPLLNPIAPSTGATTGATTRTGAATTARPVPTAMLVRGLALTEAAAALT